MESPRHREGDRDGVRQPLGATVAFAAGFQLPGGYGDDGTASLKDKPAFTCFMFLNNFARATSVATVILLVYGKASRSAGSWKSFVMALHGLWLSLNCLMLAFYTALTAVSSKGDRYGLLAINVSIQVLIFYITTWIAPATESWRTLLGSLWRSRLRTRQHAIIKRQYPFAGASVPNFLLFLVINFVVSIGFVVVPNPSVYSAYLTGSHKG